MEAREQKGPDLFPPDSPNPTVRQYRHAVYVHQGSCQEEGPAGVLIKLAFELLQNPFFIKSTVYEVLHGFGSVLNSAF